MAERFRDFEIRRFKNWSSWAENKNFKTNLLAYEARQLDKNKHMALDDGISEVVV